MCTFLGGLDESEVSIAFANTVRRHSDELDTPGELRAWLATWSTGGIEDAVLLRLGDFRSLRESVRSALGRAVERAAIPDDAINRLNAASAMAPGWLVLWVEGGSRPTVDTETAGTSQTTRILAWIARSAIELLGGPDAARLHECPACGRFFLASRQRQVWCSSSCGNRTRVARHRSRRAAVIASG